MRWTGVVDISQGGEAGGLLRKRHPMAHQLFCATNRAVLRPRLLCGFPDEAVPLTSFPWPLKSLPLPGVLTLQQVRGYRLVDAFCVSHHLLGLTLKTFPADAHTALTSKLRTSPNTVTLPCTRESVFKNGLGSDSLHVTATSLEPVNNAWLPRRH